MVHSLLQQRLGFMPLSATDSAFPRFSMGMLLLATLLTILAALCLLLDWISLVDVQLPRAETTYDK